MSVRRLFRPAAVPAGKAFVRPLAALLLMSTALPAFADTALPGDRLLAGAEDAGPIDPAAPMTATIWLTGSNGALLDGYVADRYNPKSPNYHRWLSAQELAGFGPSAQNIATMRQSLAALGLKVESVLPDGVGIKVSGAAGTMQSAFGTSIHLKQSSGVSFFTNMTAPRYQGAHAELVTAVSGLSSIEMQPYALRQLDLSTGLPAAGIPLAQNGSFPLSSFTTDCFGRTITAAMSGGFTRVSANYTGQSYLNPATIFRPQCGYTAQQIVAHYGLNTVHANGLTGKGQTIVIVDAYGSPTIAADVNTFSQAMGLPAMNGTSLQIVYPDGQPAAPDAGWATETSLDVEWAHAVAPDANIVLVVAPNANNAELAYAVHYAVAHQLGNVISNSWGSPESGNSATNAQMFNSVFQAAAAAGISVNVSTGDNGDFGVGSPVGAASIPADSPYATGVGGTSINLPSDNGPVDAAWGITLTQLGETSLAFPTPRFVGFLEGGGGGESVYLAKPSYQKNLPGTGRQLPDVSALADPQTGAITVMTNPATGKVEFFVTGGTSLAAPMFSAIWALANQAAGQSLGQAAPALAAMPSSAFRDIVPLVATHHSAAGSITNLRTKVTTTYNPAQLLGLTKPQPGGFLGTLLYVGLTPFQGYNVVGFGTDSSLNTGVGWDNATGYGEPNGSAFIAAAKQFARPSM